MFHVKPPTQRATGTLALGLALAICLDTAGQLLWKAAVTALPPPTSLLPWLQAILSQPLFLAVVAVFLLQLFNWLHVLQQADLGFAQPMTSLSYITVTGLSALLFDEPIRPVKTVGILCILAGVWIISQGQPLTPRGPESSP